MRGDSIVCWTVFCFWLVYSDICVKSQAECSSLLLRIVQYRGPQICTTMIKGTHLSDRDEGHSRVPSEQSIIDNTKERTEKTATPKVQTKITNPAHTKLSLWEFS